MAITFPTSLDGAATLHQAVNDCTGTLASGYTAGGTSLELVSAALFPSTGGVIYVANERTTYTGKSSNTLTGVTALSNNYSSGASVQMTIDAAHHNDLRDAIVAIETKLGIDGSAVATSIDKRVADLESGGGITATSTTTFQNKTISLSNNTLGGSLSEFNAACSDADFVSTGGTETLTNKTLTSPDINGGTIDGATVGATTPSTGAFTSLTTSGNLAFTGTGNRITGDFSNATLANRVMFQTSVPNENTIITVLNGKSNTGASVFQCFAGNDPLNASYAQFGVGGSSFQLISEKSGTGTYLPMTFSTGGSERMRIATDGTLTVKANAGAASHTFSYDENGGQILLYDELGQAATLLDQASNVTRLLEVINGSNLVLGLGASNTTGVTQFMRAGYVEAMRIDSSGNVLVTSATGLGYGTGAGGTVTQATSKATAVTLNKPTGKITTAADALAGGTTTAFAVLNSLVAANDVAIVTTTDSNYVATAYGLVAGAFAVRLTNITGGSLSNAVGINFAIIKGATS